MSLDPMKLGWKSAVPQGSTPTLVVVSPNAAAPVRVHLYIACSDPTGHCEVLISPVASTARGPSRIYHDSQADFFLAPGETLEIKPAGQYSGSAHYSIRGFTGDECGDAALPGQVSIGT
jgi:hypothetical protein